MRFSILYACAALAVAGPAQADIITVDDDLMDLPTADFTSVVSAINAAADGDEIIVYPGTYGSPSNGINMRGLRITVRSTDPDDPAIVDATVIQSNTGQAIRFNLGDSIETIVDGFTFTSSASGELIFVTGGAGATIRRCVFRDRTVSGNYSAIYLSGAEGVLIDRCTFENLDHTSQTGAISYAVGVSNSSDVVLTGCLWTRNDITPLYVLQGSGITLQDSRFELNTPKTSGSAGAVYILRQAEGPVTTASIVNTVFLGNRSSEDLFGGAIGGAVSISSFTVDPADLVVSIDRCSFLANEAGSQSAGGLADGGAIIAHRCDLTVTSSVFIGNEATVSGTGDPARGGAIYMFGTSAEIAGSTFHGNRAVVANNTSLNTAKGAGINADSSTVSLSNSVFRANRRANASSSEVNNAEGFTPDATNLTSGNPLYVRTPNDGGDGWGNTPGSGTNEGLNDDFGDVRLASGSPAINAGDNAEVISTIDLDGDLRIRGGLVDQGAYESRFARYFVDASVAMSGNATEWNEAVQTIAELPIDGGEAEVRFAEGTYVVPSGGFELGTDAWIRGGYNPNNGNQNPANNPVVLTGDINGDDLPGGVNRADNADHVILAQNATDITIESLTIRGGRGANNGGGVRLDTVTGADFRDVVIEDNDAPSGGGLYAFDSDVSIVDSIIRGNRGSTGAAGLRFQGASVGFISGSEISGNTTTDSGGGLSFRGGATGFIESTLIADNHADSGIGGVKVRDSGTHVELFNTQLLRNTADAGVSAIRFANSSSGIIAQSVVAGNSAPSGGTVRTRDTATLLLRQSTIADNTTSSELSAGLLQSESSTMNVLNSIVHSNTSAAASTQGAQLSGSGITLDYSLVEGWDGSFAGTGSVDGDPMFVDAMNGDYRIGAGSDAIDAGDSITFVLIEDLDGNPRVLDDTGTPDTGIGGPPVIDMGAYEFQGTTPMCPGDIADDFGTLGADGMVSFGDFLALLGVVGPCPGMTPGCDGDIADDFGTLNGGDGQVSFGDFLALLGLVGPCP